MPPTGSDMSPGDQREGTCRMGTCGTVTVLDFSWRVPRLTPSADRRPRSVSGTCSAWDGAGQAEGAVLLGFTAQLGDRKCVSEWSRKPGCYAGAWGQPVRLTAQLHQPESLLVPKFSGTGLGLTSG